MSKKKRIAGGRRPNAAQERARAMIAQAERRERWRLFTIVGAGAAVVVALVVVLVVTSGGQHSTSASASGIPGTPSLTATGRTTSPPWSTPADTAAAVKAAGLPMLTGEGTAEHIHAHLDVIVDGSAVTVPAEVGIDDQAQTISPLHTHDTSGVIHIESPVTTANFSLGQFFTEWRVALGTDHLGGLTAGGGQALRAYVNGKLYQGNPAAIILHAHDEIALVYGPATQQPNPPSSYAFPSGE